MGDQAQRLNTALLEQRAAIEPQPGSADNEWELRRERLAQLGIQVADLTTLGPQAVQPRELLSFSSPAVALNFGVQAIMHPSGFWLLSVFNRSAVQIAINAYADIGTVLALAGFSSAGASVTRSGFRQDPNFAYAFGITTAGQPFGWNLLGAQAFNFSPPLWVEPGRVLAFTCGTVNTAQNIVCEVMAPTTRGPGV